MYLVNYRLYFICRCFFLLLVHALYSLACGEVFYFLRVVFLSFGAGNFVLFCSTAFSFSLGCACLIILVVQKKNLLSRSNLNLNNFK
jgi:hypothetical protein